MLHHIKLTELLWHGPLLWRGGQHASKNLNVEVCLLIGNRAGCGAGALTLLALLALLAAKVAFVVSPVPVRQPAPPARVPHRALDKNRPCLHSHAAEAGRLVSQSLRCLGNSPKVNGCGLKLQSTTSRHTFQHESSSKRRQNGGYALAFWFACRGCGRLRPLQLAPGPLLPSRLIARIRTPDQLYCLGHLRPA